MEAKWRDEADTAAVSHARGSSVSAPSQNRRLRSVSPIGAGGSPTKYAYDGGAAGGGMQRCLAVLDAAIGSAPDELGTSSFVEAADFAGLAEELSRRVEYLQLLAAAAVDRTRTEAINAAGPANRAAGWTTGWGTDSSAAGLSEGTPTDAQATVGNGDRGAAAAHASGPVLATSIIQSPADDGCRNTAEYLRTRLRISVGEARRRLALAAAVLPRIGLPGQSMPAEREETAAALATGTIASRAGTIIAMALDRVRHVSDPATLARIEHSLTETAINNDHDFLSRIAHRWVDAVDQDGTEPSEEELGHRQGAFLRRTRRGLHHLEIFATTDQYEHLVTVMNVATNPRAIMVAAAVPGSVNEKDNLDRRTRAQRLLDGLVGACKTALATATLPATGGLRPQVMVTISYQDLLNRLETSAAQGPRYKATRSDPASSGTFTFAGPATPGTIRKIACDADIIPVLLGSNGRILDIGRASRIFPPHIRKALAARDQGCAFPNCTIPAAWCEAHHITYWSQGGSTSTDNGVLLCTHHHHLIHKEKWRIHLKSGVPWFTPPPHIDPHQKPRQNHHHRT
ncbi:DUF222 domain-containing protein [Arthrobacter sp. NA-172]|uniref:HNH endonuclease signature motif containing protein n=1 Tax=Arthrobacter sp. NA-172 TaxID=3367524 RepID=UPI00375485EC